MQSFVHVSRHGALTPLIILGVLNFAVIGAEPSGIIPREDPDLVSESGPQSQPPDTLNASWTIPPRRQNDDDPACDG